jgi:hypothetical protein
VSRVEAGLSVEEWRESFRFDDKEDEMLFARYCNDLIGDARFRRLLNQLEAVITVAWKTIPANDTLKLAELKMRMEAVQVLREALAAGRAPLIVADLENQD